MMVGTLLYSLPNENMAYWVLEAPMATDGTGEWERAKRVPLVGHSYALDAVLFELLMGCRAELNTRSGLTGLLWANSKQCSQSKFSIPVISNPGNSFLDCTLDCMHKVTRVSISKHSLWVKTVECHCGAISVTSQTTKANFCHSITHMLPQMARA